MKRWCVCRAAVKRCSTRMSIPRGISARRIRAIWRMRLPVIPRRNSDPICQELFREIDKDTVDFVPNYDNTLKEPTLLPTTFPSILVNSNVGIAVSMASNICPFISRNFATPPSYTYIYYARLQDTLLGPDFPGGGYLLHDQQALDTIYETGRGSVKIRGKYHYDKSQNCIEITQIPPTTTIEAIMDKMVDLIKQGKIRELSDMRDENRPVRLKNHPRSQTRGGPGQADEKAVSFHALAGFVLLQL